MSTNTEDDADKLISRKSIVLQTIKPYKWLILSAIIALFVYSSTMLTLPWIMKIVIDEIIPHADYSLLWKVIGGYILIYSIRMIFFYISHFLTYYVSQKILFDIRKKLFQHLQKLSISFYHRYRTGKLISNVISDVATLQEMISSTMITVAVNVVLIILYIIVLFAINWKLALICLTVTPFHFMNFLHFKKKILNTSEKRREKVSEISGNLAEILNGTKLVKSFAKEKWESKIFTADIRQLLYMNMTINMQGLYCAIIADIFLVLGITLALGFGGYFILTNQMTLGEFIQFNAYLQSLFPQITALSGLSQTIAQGTTSANRISNLLSQEIDVKDSRKPIHKDHLKGDIVFKDVVFKMEDRTIINKLNLTIKKGESVALVGPSGSGKSTLANLLMRFYDINEGSISIDGTDISKIKISFLRRNMGVVQQDAFLFSGTIRENILYGKDNATEEELINAAKKADIHDHIMTLPEGYESKTGENGVNLSGGQKQRLSIARTLLHDPDILILDEATSALDNHSEKAVQKALENLTKNRTTITIAHRLSTIINVDRIVVMKNGEIIEVGSHNELLEKNGLYKEMYQLSQQQEGEIS
jgi:ABC-type multidrug transport system fused ATPase/permease subunit